MSYSSRVYRQRNAHTPDEIQQQPFFSKRNDISKSSSQSNAFFQAKLAVNAPGDNYEKEADNAANALVNNKTAIPAVKQNKISSIQQMSSDPEKEKLKKIHKKEDPQKEEEKEKKKQTVQTKQDGNAITASSQVSSKIESSAGKGDPMPAKASREMSASFGADFSNVRVHHDSESASMNKELHAHAFTHENDIYFNSGKYNPENHEGKFLLAHELTHVVQQDFSIKEKGIQRKTGDGHDLTAEQLAGDAQLEAAFDGEFVFRKNQIIPKISVLKLQQALIGVGQKLPKFGTDGQYGDETEKAVSSFQLKSGLTTSEIDGRAGSQTITLLNNQLTSIKPVQKIDVPILDGLQTLKTGILNTNGTETELPNLDVNSQAEKQVTPSQSGSSEVSEIDIKGEVDLGVKLLSKGDNKPKDPLDPCRFAQLQSNVTGELQIKGVVVGQRVQLFYNKPQFKLTLPSSPCNDLPELSLETNIINIEAVPKILELSLKPTLKFPDGHLVPGGTVDAEITPFGNSTTILKDVKISGSLDLTSEKEDGQKRSLKLEGGLNIKTEF